MMLGLFKEDERPITRDQALIFARRLLISSLNKGSIPKWEDFLRELPSLISPDDLESVKSHFIRLTEWPFLENILDLGGTEFFFHSPETSQRLHLSGVKERVTVPLVQEDWQLWLEIISIHFNQNWNVENPFVSFYGELFGGHYRIGLIHASTSPLGVSKMILRSLAQKPHPLGAFGETSFIETLVKEKKNFLIAGSTGSGKTSLLTSLLQGCDPDEHIIILEDTYEILCTLDHQTRLLAGDSEKTSLKAYLSYSLRLTPDRIILGEMRSHEVVPFLMAMNTGHRGLMATIHSSSGIDALHRVAMLFGIYGNAQDLSYEKTMDLLCRNLEYVVFMENKKVKEVIKVLGSDKGVPFFENALGSNNADIFHL